MDDRAFRFFLGCAAGLSCVLVMPAQADDFKRDNIRGDIYCFPLKYASDLVRKLARADASKKDVVDSPLASRFLVLDGGDLPDKYFIREKDGEGDEGTAFTLLPDGRVPDFLEKIRAADRKSDLCILDPARAGRPGDDEGLYFEMGLTPEFKNQSGAHTMDELREGTKDGKSLYKKMIPSAARLFMPDTDHLSLRYDNIKTPLGLEVFKGGEALRAPETEIYNDAHIFDLEELKEMGADKIVISGGTYTLSPVPSVKTMKRFGMGEKNVTTKKSSPQ